jgi:uncharacterized protein (DUF362 family)
MVRSVLEPLGGLGKFVEKDDSVILKPNLVTNRKYFTGATTDPLIILALIRELKALGVSDITVADSSWTGCPTERAFNATGMKGLCEREDVKLFDLKKDKFVKVDVTAGTELGGSVEIARTILEADKLINIPKLKAHCQAKVTLSLKNLKGCIPDDEKQRFHRLNLDYAIAELNTVLRSDLIVLDAIIGEMTAELGCDPIRLDTIVAGTDPVAVDSVCSTMLGYEPREIEHIRYASEFGVGEGLDLDDIELKGDVGLENIKKTVEGGFGFERYTNAFKNYGLEIKEAGACSCCIAALYIALKRVSDNEDLDDLVGSEIYIGQNVLPTYSHLVGIPKTSEDTRRIGIGKCSKDLEGLDLNVAGCPPTALRIYKMLQGKF